MRRAVRVGMLGCGMWDIGSLTMGIREGCVVPVCESGRFS